MDRRTVSHSSENMFLNIVAYAFEIDVDRDIKTPEYFGVSDSGELKDLI